MKWPALAGEFLAEARPHECNVYCRGDLHASLFYADGELPSGTVAIIAGRKRYEIEEVRPAPEVPPVDPSDPEGRAWTHRFVIWAREVPDA